MALTLALGLNVKLRDFPFDTPLQNMNRTGSALSIIYTLSFSISCLSALVAVTCPDTNGGWKHLSVFQQSPLEFCTVFFQRNIPETAAIPFSAAILHCMSLCGVVLLKVSIPEGASAAVLSINADRNQFYSHFGAYHAVFLQHITLCITGHTCII